MTAWPSLRPLAAVAERLGASPDAWLAREAARVDDPAFAALFDGIEVAGVARMDFAHRLVRTARGRVLGGIRFYGRDVARPFVEVIAHGLEPEALRRVVAAEWAAFAPRALRVLVRPGTPLPADAALDLTVHAARMGAMARPDGRVSLGAIDPARAHRLVARRYAAMEPGLRRDVAPADPEDLRRCAREGTLHAILAAGEVAGVLATEPGAVAFLEGCVVAEEAVRAPFAGRGLAASAQAALAASRPPERLLLGTIHARNGASRRTAERAGRPEVMRHAFLPLPGGARGPS